MFVQLFFLFIFCLYIHTIYSKLKQILAVIKLITYGNLKKHKQKHN